MTLHLQYAGAPYLDRMALIESGVVSPRGVTLEYVQFDDVGELFRRVAQGAEFDVAEMSMSTYIALVASNDDRFTAIPVFPSRAFRHSQIYVNTEAGITRPEDLAGRKVGVPEYQMTAALWIRAFLTHDHGVRPEDIHWMTGGLTTPDYAERHHIELPKGVSLSRIPADTTLERALDDGIIDALATAHAPAPFRDRSPKVDRLFPDYRTVETEYFRRTGFFPIMHTVVIKRDVYERDHLVAVSLLDAFEEAKQQSNRRLVNLDSLAVNHPWIADEITRLAALFGRDPFTYGLEHNHEIVEAMIGYSVEQGLSDRHVDIEELFAPETLDWSPQPDVFTELRH